MAVYHAESLLFGPFAERPQLSDPTIYSASGIALFLAADTGELYETSGSAWTLLGTLTSLPGVTSDAANGLLAPSGTVKASVVAFYPTADTGAPIAGAHTQGQMICDAAGNTFICTADGTPGTWRQISYV